MRGVLAPQKEQSQATLSSGGSPVLLCGRVRAVCARNEQQVKKHDPRSQHLWLRLTKGDVYATIGASMPTEQRLSRDSRASPQTGDMRSERKTLASAGSRKSAKIARHGGTTQSWRRRKGSAEATDVFCTT